MGDYLFTRSEFRYLWKSRGSEQYILKQFLDNKQFPRFVLFDDTERKCKVVGKVVDSSNSGESYFWERLEHENLVPLLAISSINEKVSVFISPFFGRCLKAAIYQNEFIQDPIYFHRKAKYARDILNGLSYLHRKSLCLLNLDGANIYVCPESDKAVIYNFSCIMPAERVKKSDFDMPTLYHGPELSDSRYHEDFYPIAAEMWACGVLLFQLFTQYAIPPKITLEAKSFIKTAIMAITCNTLKVNDDSIYLCQFVPKLQKFLFTLIKIEPKQRASSEEAANSPFLQKLIAELNADVNYSLLYENYLCNCNSNVSNRYWDFLKATVEKQNRKEKRQGIKKPATMNLLTPSAVQCSANYSESETINKNLNNIKSEIIVQKNILENLDDKIMQFASEIPTLKINEGTCSSPVNNSNYNYTEEKTDKKCSSFLVFPKQEAAFLHKASNEDLEINTHLPSTRISLNGSTKKESFLEDLPKTHEIKVLNCSSNMRETEDHKIFCQKENQDLEKKDLVKKKASLSAEILNFQIEYSYLSSNRSKSESELQPLCWSSPMIQCYSHIRSPYIEKKKNNLKTEENANLQHDTETHKLLSIRNCSISDMSVISEGSKPELYVKCRKNSDNNVWSENNKSSKSFDKNIMDSKEFLKISGMPLNESKSNNSPSSLKQYSSVQPNYEHNEPHQPKALKNYVHEKQKTKKCKSKRIGTLPESRFVNLIGISMVKSVDTPKNALSTDYNELSKSTKVLLRKKTRSDKFASFFGFCLGKRSKTK